MSELHSTPPAADQVTLDDPEHTYLAPFETEADAVAEANSLEQAPSLGARFFNLRTLVSFGLGFAIIVFLFTRVQIDVSAILERVSQANPWLLALAVVAYYLTFPTRAVRWGRLLRNAGFRGEAHLPGLAGLTEIIVLSWFANCIVPAKLGDAYRAYLLKRDARVSFSATIGTILAERIIDVLVLFVLMVGAASLAFGRALPPEVVLLMQAGLLLAVVVVLGLVALRNLRPLVERLLPRRFHDQYAHFERGTLSSFRMYHTLPQVLALTGATWAGEVLRLGLVTLALGLVGVAPSVIVFVALASALATTLPLTPAGLGFAEGTIVAVFLLAARAGLAPGVDEHAAASIALLDRAISYWSLVLVGLVTYVVSSRR
jgi:glycosyltransferase 2 family protein